MTGGDANKAGVTYCEFVGRQSNYIDQLNTYKVFVLNQVFLFIVSSLRTKRCIYVQIQNTSEEGGAIATVTGARIRGRVAPDPVAAAAGMFYKSAEG